MEILSDRFVMSVDRFIMSELKSTAWLTLLDFFIQCSFSVFAPVDDFKFFVAMNWYQEEDSDIATAVSSSINRYLWYLTEEFVILSLFNEKLSDFTGKFLIGKPTFPTLNSSTFIYFLIGLRSGLLFDLLGLIND